MPPLNTANKGFVLVATLWILAVVTIAAGFFATWTQRAVDAATALQADMQAQIDLHDSRETLLYLLAVGYKRPEGIRIVEPDVAAPMFEETNPDPLSGNLPTVVIPEDAPRLALFDQVYQGRGEVTFALQDEGGLFNINHPYHVRRLSALLGFLDIPGDQRDSLSDSLKDYIDIDNLRRLNGAEAREYKALELLPPTNRTLHTFAETQRIYGWRTVLQDAQYAQLARLTTTAPAASIPSLNSAPDIVLMLNYGFSLSETRLLIAARAQQALLSPHQVDTIAGRAVGLDPFNVSFSQSPYIRITFMDAKHRNLLRLHIHLTHASPIAPWQVLQHYRLPFQAFYDDTPQTVAKPYFVKRPAP